MNVGILIMRHWDRIWTIMFLYLFIAPMLGMYEKRKYLYYISQMVLGFMLILLFAGKYLEII